MSQKDDKKDVVDLSDPKTKQYKERIAAAKSGRTPVGGVPMPDIPPLDQPPPGSPRDRSMGVQQSHEQQSNFQSMSPEEYQKAVSEGRIVPGVGSAYTANHPNYQTPPEEKKASMEVSSEEGPVNPPRPEGGLRPETAKQLEDVAKANQEEEQIEKDVDIEYDPDDDMDYESFGRLARSDQISNKKRRETIEARCEELQFEDLIFNQELRQDVPIRKNFTPTYRTPNGEEDLYVKRRISDESGSDRYVMDKYAVMSLCCGLFSINGKPLPDHRKSDGEIDDQLFDAKLKHILKFPMVVIVDLSVNFTWFTERVQGLLAIEKVKDF